MHKTRQHIPSFVGVYIPPCGDVLSGIDIRICNISAVIAMEVFAVTLTDMVADVAGLGCVSWFYGDKPDTSTLTLILQERAELSERPRVCLTSNVFTLLLLGNSKANIGKVFNGDTLMLRLSLLYKLFAYGVIGNGSKPAFTSFEPFQQPMTVACAFGLNGSSRSIVSISHPLDFGRRGESIIGSSDNIRDTHIYTDKLVNRFLILLRDVYGLKKKKLALTENQVHLTFGKLHKFRAIAGIGDFLTSLYQGNGNLAVRCVRKNPAVVGYRTKLPELAHFLLVKLVSICNLAYRSNDELRRKVVSFLDRVIRFLMEVKLLKRVTLPCNLRNRITRLVEYAHRLFERIRLSVSRKQFYLKGKFHTAKLDNIQFVQLFETYKLLTKEGICAIPPTP